MTRLLPGGDAPLLLLLFALPAAITAAGGAAVAELAFPASATLLALAWAPRGPARYMRLLLWLLILAPGLRHFVDWYAGFSQTNPIMLAPYLAVFAATPTVALYLLGGRRYAVEFLLLIAAIAFALGIALTTGAVTAGLLAGMRWLAPPWLAIYICACAGDLAEMRASVLRTFQIALPVVGLYGIAQFADIAPWDAYFMQQAPINSIGYPEPFLVRVFGTMNSPGSLAAMLATGILLLLPRARRLAWIGILLAFVALLLTTQRAALGAFAVAVLLLAFLGRDHILRRKLGRMAAVLTVACGLLLSVPGAERKLMGTAESIANLKQDTSAQERERQYDEFLPLLDAQKLGRGLGWEHNGVYINIGDEISLDSGLIDIFVGLGLPGGMVFLAALGTLAFQGLRICRWDPDGASAEFAAAVYGLVQLPFGSQHTAEHGLFLYLALGLVLARPLAAAAPTIAARTNARILL
jgi:hypothetical protein